MRFSQMIGAFGVCAGAAFGQPTPSQPVPPPVIAPRPARQPLPPTAPNPTPAPGTSPAPKPSPQMDPALNDPSLDPETSPHRLQPGDAPIAPTPPKPPQRAAPSVPAVDAPGVAGLDSSLPVRRFFPEGSFLSARTGKVIKARTGDLIFVPDRVGSDAAAEHKAADPAMVLLACQKLGQLEMGLGSAGTGLPVMMSGQVFVYHDRNYLLPMVFSTQAAAPVAAAPAAGATPSPSVAKDADPRVEDLIKDLESQRSVPRAMDPARRAAERPISHPGSNPVPQPGQPTPKGTEVATKTGQQSRMLTPEGTVLVLRRGRLIRQAGDEGRFAFAFDNDPNSPAPGPMTIVPCAQLQQLEALCAAKGDDLCFKMSGRTLVYQGRNYLLPTTYQVVTPGEVTPMQ